jgi:nucleotide-binding universal stress UspA family protein
MSSPWSHEQLQHAIHEEVAAVVYAETHERRRTPAVDEKDRAQDQAGPDVADVPTVVVGVDRSPASDSAVAWAAAEAVRRGGRLVLVRAEGLGDLPLPAAQWDEEEQRLHALAASVRDAHPSLDDVTSELIAGAAGPVLVVRAAAADLLVVGSHGRGAVSRAVLGSASAYCAVHAPVPTVVVPRDWSGRRPSEA